MALSPIKIVIAGVDKYSKNFKKVEKSLGRIRDMSKKVGSAFTRNVTAPVVAGAALSVKAGYDYEKSMNTIQAKTQSLKAPVDALGESFFEMGDKLNVPVRTIAAGGEFLAQANYNVKQINNSMQTLIKTADATNTPLAETSDIVSNVVAAFGEVPEALDKYALAITYASAKANTNAVEMGEAFKDAAPAANALGITVENLSGTIGVLADNNIKGSKATTTLKNIILELASKSAKLKEIGIPIMNAEGNARGLSMIFKDIMGKMEGMSRAQKLVALEDLFSKRAVAGALIIGQESLKTNNRIEQLSNTMKGFTKNGVTNTKVLDKMFATIKSGRVLAVDKLTSGLDNLRVRLSMTGAFDPLIDLLGSMVKSVAAFVKEYPGLSKMILTLMLLAAVIGPILLVVGGLMQFVIITKAFIATIGGIMAIGKALAFVSLTGVSLIGTIVKLSIVLLTTPIGWIILAVTALIGILYVLQRHVGGVGNAFKIMGGFIIKGLLTPINLVAAGIELLLRGMSKIPGMGDKFGKAADSIKKFRESANVKLTGNASITQAGMLSDIVKEGAGASSWTAKAGLGGAPGAASAAVATGAIAAPAGKQGKIQIDFTGLPEWLKPKAPDGDVELGSNNGPIGGLGLGV